MKLSNILKQILIVVLFISCSSKKKLEIKDITLESITVDTPPPPPPLRPRALKVSAYLIFDDKSISTFDVLNDSTIALWNTIIGGGDAVKPSNNTKIILSGNLDSLNIRIFNGKKKVVDKMIPHTSGNLEYIIKNTGCEKVNIIITKNKKTVYEKKIPFECGE